MITDCQGANQGAWQGYVSSLSLFNTYK